MIGKIVTGKSFGGAVEYVLRKEKARLLESDGVDTEGIRSIIDDFNFQRKARREIAKVVGHISLSFHRDDAPTLTDERMRELAAAVCSSNSSKSFKSCPLTRIPGFLPTPILTLVISGLP